VGSTRCRPAAARRPSCASAPGMRTSVALPAPRRSPAAPSEMKSGTGELDHRSVRRSGRLRADGGVAVQAAGSRVTLSPSPSSWRTWVRVLRYGPRRLRRCPRRGRSGLRVGQQTPDDDQDGAADRDESVLCPGVRRSCGNAHPGTCRFGSRRQAALSFGHAQAMTVAASTKHGAAGPVDRSSSAGRRPRPGRRPGQRADDVSRCRSGHDHHDGCIFAGDEPVAEGTGESVQRLG
jgi:hypothetical protein